MLATRKSIFSKHYRVDIDDGSEITLDQATFRERAEVVIGGEPFSFERTSMGSREHALRQGDRVVATSRQPSWFKTSLEVKAGKLRATVRKPSWWSRDMEVRVGERVVGAVRRPSLFRSTVEVDLPEEWPLPVRLFVLWLVLVQWQRAEAAAVAAGS